MFALVEDGKITQMPGNKGIILEGESITLHLFIPMDRSRKKRNRYLHSRDRY